jgi:cytochrome c2
MKSTELQGIRGFLWHAIAIGVVILLPSWIVFGTQFWRTPGLNMWIVLSWAATYLVFAAGNWLLAPRLASVPVTTSAALTVLCGVAAISVVLLVAQSTSYSRDLLLLESILLLVLVVGRAIPDELSGGHLFSAVIVIALVAGIVVAHTVVRSRLVEQTERHRRTTRVQAASEQILTVDTYFNYFGGQSGIVVTGGALTPDPEANGYLFARANGEIYRLGWAKDGDLLVSDVGVRVPLNREDFYADASPQLELFGFRVADIIARREGEVTRIYVSHHHWYRDQKCFVLRVSSTTLPGSAVQRRPKEAKWETLFETQPCLPILLARGTGFAGVQAGGNLEFLSKNELLLTVGDHQFDGFYKPKNYVQDPRAHYGKTVLLDLKTGQWSIYSTGHRNPQGLTIDSKGRIWSTEQGPQGGDELNLIKKGGNYGYPMHTYGTEYGSTIWPPGAQAPNDPSLIRPVYAWVPSIAPTDLVVVSDPAFPKWKDDLVIASLRGKAIWRVRIDEGRVAYAEPIQMGHRIRDIVAGKGEFVLLTDSDEIIRLRPDYDDTAGAALFGLHCEGCHRESEDRIGPHLKDVVGREIGSVTDYSYSPALSRVEGRWTEERLDRFLANPQADVPGTAMITDGIADAANRRKIIEYLKDLE